MGARVFVAVATGLLSIGLTLLAARSRAPRAQAELGRASGAGSALVAAASADIEFAGCALLRRERRCELDRTRRLVIGYSGIRDAPIRYAFDDEPRGQLARAAEREPVADGFRVTLAVPGGARVLRLFRGGALALELELAQHREFGWQSKADALRAEGNVGRARALGEDVLASRDPEERNRARALLARLARVSGEPERAARELAETAEEAWRLGRSSDAVSDALASTYVEIVQLGRFAAAERVLERARQFAEGDASGRADWHYFSGLLARYRGELWSAGRLYREAARRNERLGRQVGVRDAAAQLAEVYAELGQFQQAHELLEGVARSSAGEPACARGSVYTHLAWIGILAAERGYPSSDVDRSLALARELNDRCGAPRARRVDRINAGLWALRPFGDLAAAKARYAELESLGGEAPNDLRVWQDELLGRILLAERAPRAALAVFERQVELALELGNDDAEARARVNVGTALEHLGYLQRALSAYREADALLHRTPVPIGVPRDGYFGVRDGALVRLLDAQIALGRTSEAFESALRAYRRGSTWGASADRLEGLTPRARAEWRAAVAAYFAARQEATRGADQDWRFASDEAAAITAYRTERTRQAVDALHARALELGVAAPAESAELSQHEDELALAVVPAQRAWHLLSRFRGSERAFEVPPPAHPPAPGDSWFAPLEAELRRARRVLLLPFGAASAIDWANAPVGTQRLVDRLELVQPLGVVPRGPPAAAVSPRALIVADPGSDLPSARADAQELAGRLAPRATIVLVGDAASRQSVLANLEQSTFFYYAGHGEPSDFDGTSGLPLAFGERLLPSDVLALPRAPELVVLAACDAGRSQSGASASGWSVAHAFVLAGARQVVAPVRPVNDRAASTLGRALFDGGRAGDLVAGFTRAARTMRAAGLDGWAPFRVYVP